MIKKFFILLLCCSLFSGYLYAETEDNPKFKINPTIDKTSNTGFYIPKNLDDCFTELKKMLSPVLIEDMKSGSEDDMAQYHHGLGMWMRNNWGLWSGSRLQDYFKLIGIQHPDDMSGIILNSFWRYLNTKSIELDKQVQYYKDYWEKQK